MLDSSDSVIFYKNLNWYNVSFQNSISNANNEFSEFDEDCWKCRKNNSYINILKLTYTKFSAYFLIDGSKTMTWNKVKKSKRLHEDTVNASIQSAKKLMKAEFSPIFKSE